MIHILTLKYVRPLEEVKAHLGTHKQWLTQHIGAGRILAAGPLPNHSGGLVLAACSDRAELDAMIAEDSFVQQQLVAVSVQSFEPAICGAAWAAHWPGSAAVVPA